MKNKVRNAHISLAVGVALLIADLILFHDNEAVMNAIGMAAFAVCLGLFMILDEREYRARTRQRQNHV